METQEAQAPVAQVKDDDEQTANALANLSSGIENLIHAENIGREYGIATREFPQALGGALADVSAEALEAVEAEEAAAAGIEDSDSSQEEGATAEEQELDLDIRELEEGMVNPIVRARTLAPFDGIVVLDLSDIGLKHLHGSSLEHLQLLEVLMLGHNQLTDLESLCTASLSRHLWTLDFSNNRLTSIPPFKDHRLFGTLMFVGNNLTYQGVEEFLDCTVVVELYLENNPALTRQDYRSCVTRLVAGVMVLDGKYITESERLEAWSIDSSETVSLAPGLTRNRSYKPRFRDLSTKVALLRSVMKKARLLNKGIQLVSFILADVEEYMRKRGRTTSSKTALELEKRRLRYLSLFYTACFNLLQGCPAQSLFEYAIDDSDTKYYSSSLSLEEAIQHCAKYSQVPGVNLRAVCNALPFCIHIWKDRPNAMQYLVQLFLCCMHFDFELELIEETVRRTLLQDSAKTGKPISTTLVESLARSIGLLPPYARLAMLVLLCQGNAAITQLVNDCMSLLDPEYLYTLALSTQKMFEHLGFTIDEEVLDSGEYAVAGSSEGNQDFFLPGEFVDMGRNPYVVSKQQRRTAQREQEERSKRAAKAADDEYLQKRHSQRTMAQPKPKIRSGPSGHLRNIGEEKKEWLRAQESKRWQVGIKVEEDARDSASFCPSYRMPQVGERAQMPYREADGNVVNRWYLVKEELFEGREFRLVPLQEEADYVQQKKQRSAQAKKAKTQRLYRERNARESRFWKGSELWGQGPSDQDNNLSNGSALSQSIQKSAPTLFCGEGDAIFHTKKESHEQGIAVPWNSLIWIQKGGYWKYVGPNETQQAAQVPPPSRVPSAGRRETRSPSASPQRHTEAERQISPTATPIKPASPMQGLSPGKGDEGSLFLTGLPFDLYDTKEVDQTLQDTSPMASVTNPLLQYGLDQASPPDPHADPHKNLHPFHNEYKENCSRLKRRMQRIWAQYPPYEPPINPVTGEPACSLSQTCAQKGYHWERQANFFLPALFRTKLLQAKIAPPVPTPKGPKKKSKSSKSNGTGYGTSIQSSVEPATRINISEETADLGEPDQTVSCPNNVPLAPSPIYPPPSSPGITFVDDTHTTSTFAIKNALSGIPLHGGPPGRGYTPNQAHATLDLTRASTPGSVFSSVGPSMMPSRAETPALDMVPNRLPTPLSGLGWNPASSMTHTTPPMTHTHTKASAPSPTPAKVAGSEMGRVPTPISFSLDEDGFEAPKPRNKKKGSKLFKTVY